MLLRPKSAFVLYELIVVLCLISLLCGIMICSRNPAQRFAVRSDLDTLYTICYLQQQKAIIYNKPVSITFFDTYYIIDDQKMLLSPQVRFGVPVHAKGPPSSPTKPITNPITFPNRTMICFPDGIISSGTVYLIHKLYDVTYALSSGVGHSSCLRKYHYDNKRWHLIV